MNHSTFLGLAATVLLASACGGASSTTGTEPASSLESRAATLTALSDTRLSIVSAMLDDTVVPSAMKSTAVSPAARWAISRPVYFLLKDWIGGIPQSCISESGWVDADGDGLPVSATYQFSCRGVGSPNGRYDASGSITVRDHDDADPYGGFDMEFAGFYVRRYFEGNVPDWARTVDGRMAFGHDPHSTTGGWALDEDLVISLLENTTSAGIERTSFALTSTVLYQPDILSRPAYDPFASGTATEVGGLSVTHISMNRPISETWASQTMPTLHWNRSCNNGSASYPRFDRGALLVRDNLGQAFMTTYYGCGNWSTKAFAD